MVMNKENKPEVLRSISQFFTSSTLRKIIDEENFEVIDQRLASYHINTTITRIEQIKLFYKDLYKNYKVEYLYKNTLLNKILLGKYSTNTSTAFDEFKIGFSIADFVLLNGEAKIFEIKTELDSLEKLDKQIKDYRKFGDKIYVVSNSKFIPTLLQKYSETSIGVIEWTERNTLKTVLQAKSNKEYFEHRTIFKTLRKKEYLDLIHSFFGEIPDVPNTQIFEKCLDLCETIPVERFQRKAVEILKRRKLRCPEYLTSKKTPYELKYLCHTMDLKEKQYVKLHNFLNQK